MDSIVVRGDFDSGLLVALKASIPGFNGAVHIYNGEARVVFDDSISPLSTVHDVIDAYTPTVQLTRDYATEIDAATTLNEMKAVFRDYIRGI